MVKSKDTLLSILNKAMESEHLQAIAKLTHSMDVIIIAVTSFYEETFWQKRLNQMHGQVTSESTKVVVVREDWDHGAGNALGTLYAFQKAQEKFQQKYHLDLLDLMDEDKSIAIYHTAGKGTRLSPITGCEYNSKSRIKIASSLMDKKERTPMTLLEAVIKQTSIFAPSRKGRLSVFWGDQIFIPANELTPPKGEIDLLVKGLPSSPTQKEWDNNDYSKYGLVIVDSAHSAKQLEKLSYSEFDQLPLETSEHVALSLGCFSLSKKMVEALLKEFAEELKSKSTSLDSDPHLWMPLSLDEKFYLKIMERKNTPVDFAKKHYARMQKFKKSLQKTSFSLFGASDMGHDTLWWDFGNLKSYYENTLRLTSTNPEDAPLKEFFKVPKAPENTAQNADLKIENSLLINCFIRTGHIKNSVLIGVHAHEVQATDAVIVSSCAQKIEVKQGILYNCLENGKIKVLPNQIRADSFSEEHGHIKLFNSIHPHLSWDQPVQENPLSFKDLHEINQEVNPIQGQLLAQTIHNKIKQAVFDLQK